MKPETPARTPVEFWQWRDARFLWTSSTLSGSLHIETILGTLFMFEWVVFSSDWSTCCVLSPVPDYVKATVETVVKIHEADEDGDVLAFLTGQVTVLLFNFAFIISWSHLTGSFCISIHLKHDVLLRKKWRKWCHFCRSRPGLCQDMAWRNTSEFCPCTLGCLTLTRWRSLSGFPPPFAK